MRNSLKLVLILSFLIFFIFETPLISGQLARCGLCGTRTSTSCGDNCDHLKGNCWLQGGKGECCTPIELMSNFWYVCKNHGFYTVNCFIASGCEDKTYYYDNCYGRDINHASSSNYPKTDSGDPSVPSDFNGAYCAVNYWDTYCYNYFGSQYDMGRWDADQKGHGRNPGCAECNFDTHQEIKIVFCDARFDSTCIEASDRCESACGASSECDEKNPSISWVDGTNCKWCNSNCIYGYDPASQSTYYESGGHCYYGCTASCGIGGWSRYGCTDGGTAPPNYYTSGSTCYYGCTVSCTETGWQRTGCSSSSLNDHCDGDVRYYDGQCVSSGASFSTENCNNYDCTTPPSYNCVGVGTDTIKETGGDYTCQSNICTAVGTKDCNGPWTCDEINECSSQSCGGSDKYCYYDGSYKWGDSLPTTETNCADEKDNDCDGKIDCFDGNDCTGEIGPNGHKCCRNEDDCGDYGSDVECGFCNPVDRECDYYGTDVLCNQELKCSGSAGGDNMYGSGDKKMISIGYCDGSGNCDYAIEGTICTSGADENLEETGVTICVDGQSFCVDTCTDGINNDADFDTNGDACTDGKDSGCGGQDTNCDNNDDDCDGVKDDDEFPKETCGDNECDGNTYCVEDAQGINYVECRQNDGTPIQETECDNKICCKCDGGTPDQPRENYDPDQDEDCNTEDTRIYCFEGCEKDGTYPPESYTLDIPVQQEIPNECAGLDTCLDPECTYTHECDNKCGAPCVDNLSCPCNSDGCTDADGDGYSDDWADYPEHGTENPGYGVCNQYSGSPSDCTCDVGTDTGQPCEAIYSFNDARCGDCGDTYCDYAAGERYSNCPEDCCRSDCTGCANSGSPSSCISDTTCHKDCALYCGNNVDVECDAKQFNSCFDEHVDCNGCLYEYCGDDGTQCCSITGEPGSCGYQNVDNYCSAGQCEQDILEECIDCGPHTCSNGICTDDCSLDCGAGCDADTDCTYLDGIDIGCQIGSYPAGYYGSSCDCNSTCECSRCGFCYDVDYGGSGGDKGTKCLLTEGPNKFHGVNKEEWYSFWCYDNKGTYPADIELVSPTDGSYKLCYIGSIQEPDQCPTNANCVSHGEPITIDTTVAGERYWVLVRTDGQPKDYEISFLCDIGTQPSEPSGGGCPYLKVWDGQEFVTLEKLGIHEEEGVDAEVQTSFTMKPIQDGKYKMILKEASYLSLDDDGSNIDYVKLTTQDGQECKLLSAIHEKEGDVILEIKNSDDIRIRTEPDEEIVLEYECYGNDFVFTIEGHNPRHPYLKLASGYIQIFIDAVKGILGLNY